FVLAEAHRDLRRRPERGGSASPGWPPPINCIARRTARPMATLAPAAGPRQPVPQATPAARRAAPLTTIRGAAGLVEDCTLATRNSGARTALVAAMTVGNASGMHPAMTATTASFSIVTFTHNGGNAPGA